MANNITGWVLVDDRDPGIAYNVPPGGILWHGGVAQEYDQTTTGLDGGDTLTYYFNASDIAVFGTYGVTQNVGRPVAIYQVDNIPATTVTAPITQDALYRQNFWTSNSDLQSLAPGAFHKLTVNATVLNTTLWIDYLAYPPTNSGMTGTGTLSTSSNVTPTIAPTNKQPHSKTNIGTIVAGVVAGIVILILATSILIWMRYRRSRPDTGACSNIREGGTSPNITPNSHGSLARPVTPPRPLSESAPSYTSFSQREFPRDQPPRPLPAVPVPVKTYDGGVTLAGGSLEMPPEYQESY